MGTKALTSDICIVGGGLTGLMMAITVSHTPYQITLLDRSKGTAPVADGRTTTIHAAGQRMLAALGVWGELSYEPAPIHAIQVMAGDAATGLKARQRPLFDLEWTSPNKPMGYVVDNHDLFTALSVVLERRIAAKKISHLTGFSVTEMIRQSSKVILNNDAHSYPPIECDLVVGCDGGKSPLRAKAGLRQISESQLPGHRPQTAIVANMRLERDHNNTAYQRFLPGGPIALMPLNRRFASLVWTVPEAEASKLLACSDGEFNSACTKAFGPALGYVNLESDRLEWPLHPTISIRMTQQNLALAGDAAHAIHPLAGQGYNLALGDAAVLADTLTKAHQRGLAASHSTILLDYEPGRRSEVAAMSTVTTGLNLLLSNKTSGFSKLIGAGMGLLNVAPFKSTLSRMAQGGMLTKASLLDGQLPS